MGLSAFGGLPGAYDRYPIHVGRAIYRLSHIKLANPQRPLYEQALISNLMFWYLGVVNKPPVPPGGEKPAQKQGASTEQLNGLAADGRDSSAPTPNGDEKIQAEAREREERERQEQEWRLAATRTPEARAGARTRRTRTTRTG